MSLVDIRIEGLDKLTVDLEQLRADASFRWPKEILDTSAEMMRDSIVREAVGSLRDKVIIEVEHNSRRVTVDSPYAVYVNDGTGPSAGRYVPAIGKRLTGGKGIKREYYQRTAFRAVKTGRFVATPNIGMHPGIRGSHFFDRGVEFATTSILGFVHRKLYEYILEI